MMPSLNAILGRLRLRQLSLLIALDEHQSLHQAAKAINVTQPAATKALNEIEDTIGAVLFERSWRGITPNLIGRCVIRYARLIHTDLSNMHEELAGLLLGQGGKVTVGSVSGPVAGRLSRAINRLRDRHPSMVVELIVDSSVRLLHRLDQGQLDLVIGRILPPRNPDLYVYRELADEMICVVAGPDHPLVGQSALTLEQLMDHPWILQHRGTPLRELIEREFALNDLPLPYMPVETSSIFATLSLLQQTDMLSAMSVEVAHLFSSDRLLTVLPVTITQRLTPYGLIVRSEIEPPPAVRIFINLLQ